jgi:hypothetical protein
LRDVILGDDQRKKMDTRLAITTALVAIVAVLAAKHVFFDNKTPSTTVATEDAAVEKNASTLSPNAMTVA